MTRRRPRIVAAALAITLLAAIEPWAPPASALPGDETWIELRSEHFRLISNAGERKSTEIARDLERFRSLLKRLRPASRMQAPVPTRVVVFKNDRSFRPYKQWRKGAGGKGLLGYFLSDQTGNFIAMNAFPDGGDSLPVVYHEFTHFYVRHNFDQLPLWVNEGLAEYYSSIDQPGGDLRIGVAIPRHVLWLRHNSFIPFERFLVIDETSPEYNEAARKGGFYAQSWALVHYLMLGDPEMTPKAPELLRLLGEGMDAEVAVQRALGVSLEELTSRLRRYINGSEFQALILDAASIAAPTAVEIRPLSQAETLVHLGDLLAQSREQPADAREHYQAALEANPRQADAWAGLGNLARLEGDYARAIEHLEKAMAIGGASARAHVWLADLLLGWSDPASRTAGRPASSTAAAGQAAGEPDWLRARTLALRALELEPDFAEADGIVGSSYFDDPGGSAPGIPALTRAAEAFHDRPEMGYNLVVFNLQAGDIEGARAARQRYLVERGQTSLAAQANEAIERTDLIERSNAAVSIQDYATAAKLLRQAIGITSDATVVMGLTTQATQLERTAKTNAQIDRFNQAVGLSNAGRREEAREILLALQQVVIDQDLQTQIARLLASMTSP